MEISKTTIQDCFIIQPSVYADQRGYFFESFNADSFASLTGIETQFVQDNESKSNYGVIRGLHAQEGAFAQAKLIRVVQGSVLDVVVDARPNSPTFGKIFTHKLTAENKTQLFIPKGCLHGFSVLEDHTIFSYKCDAFYAPQHEIGVYPLDAELNINWNIDLERIQISEKDKNSLSWEEFQVVQFTALEDLEFPQMTNIPESGN